MLNIAVLISGGGTNLKALIDGIEAGRIKDTRICQVISNNQNAYGLERARKHRLNACCIAPKDYRDREAFHQALLAALEESGADLIVLAGYLVAVPKSIIKVYKNRIINIHPSLIPAFCGTGCYGLRVHEAALKRGVRLTGATVHFVDEGMDTGPIILQQAVPVKAGDTPEILQQRVMEEAEWRILPEAVALIAAGRVRVIDGRVQITE